MANTHNPLANDPNRQARSTKAKKLRVCLAGSGGGHLRQILDLEAAWGPYDTFFVSEDTALARSISAQWPMNYVEHYAFGQTRLGKPVSMLRSASLNFFQSLLIVLKKRPHIVISTGAGSMLFVVLLSRLFGAMTIIIDSFARFDKPSLFAKMTFPWASRTVVQSKELARYWPKAAVFDPLRLLDDPRPAKKPFLFATVGATLPFDRLVRLVTTAKAAGLIPERVLIQTGVGAGSAGAAVEAVETLSFEDMLANLRDADIVVCHGGTGSLITALRNGCRIIAVPRLFELGEHYDDHQAEITKAFEARGLIEIANTPEQFAVALTKIRSEEPQMATTDPAKLVKYLQDILETRAGRIGGKH